MVLLIDVYQSHDNLCEFFLQVVIEKLLRHERMAPDHNVLEVVECRRQLGGCELDPIHVCRDDAIWTARLRSGLIVVRTLCYENKFENKQIAQTNRKYR